MDGKLCSSGEGGTDGKDLSVCTCVCGSTHDCGWQYCYGSFMSNIIVTLPREHSERMQFRDRDMCTQSERRQSQRQTELGMSSDMRVHACIRTQYIQSHEILCVLYLVLVYDDIDFN